MYVNVSCMNGGRWIDCSSLHQRDQCVREIASSKNLLALRSIHGRIGRADLFVLNKLVQAYGDHGSPDEAAAVFAGIDVTERDCFSWSVMIKCYRDNGLFTEAKLTFDAMPEWNMVALNSMLSAVAASRQMLQAKIFFDQMPAKDIFSWTTLLSSYAQSGQVSEAKRTFDGSPLVNLVSWTVMLNAYAQHGDPSRAEDLYLQMPLWDLVSSSIMLGVSPNPDAAKVIFDAMPIHNLVSCTAMVVIYAQGGQLAKAEGILHSMTQERDLVTWNAMLCAYAAVGNLLKTIETFSSMPVLNLVSWNAIISAHVQSGRIEEAKCLFDRTQEKDLTSWSSLISGFARAGDVDLSKRIFDAAPEHDTVLWNSLLLAYVRSGDLNSVTKTFESISEKDVASWNEMLYAFTHSGHLQKAVSLFCRMPRRSIISWGTILAAFAQTGKHTYIVLSLFSKLNLEAFFPDEICLASLLIACVHLGKPETGVAHFRSITTDFGITPTKQHYCCIVDLLSRSGHLASAVDLIQKMPFAPDLWEWSSVLTASRFQNDRKRIKSPKLATPSLRQDARAYTLAANILSRV